MSNNNNNNNTGSGSGSALPVPVLVSAGVCTLVAVFVSGVSIYLQLKNYRKPLLQRMVVRIMLMVPLYAVASFISLFSLEAAFVIDAIRDIYEAFVIYCFFSLLLSYLGGVRSLLILIHGRPPKAPPFPINIFKRELDVSDPHTFLFLKRGIIQYVQIKPILAAATLILKASGKYNEGDFRANSGYLYVSIIYNISICLALYCLAMFWLCVSEDLKPFRPVPKFLCVKGILFFSFWQSIGISILVAANAITRLGPYTDAEHISVGLNDTLICIEMPFFALAHLYAFSYTDFLDPRLHFCARMPLQYAFVDAFSIKDVVEDIKATLRGEGMDYRDFEPAEGMMHQGSGRDRRIKAGLRYSKGGKKKYWLPRVQNEARLGGGRIGRVLDDITGDVDDVHAPLLQGQVDDVSHLAPDMRDEPTIWDPIHRGLHVDSLGFEIPFGDVDPDDEELFNHCRHYVFGDYNYPVIDVSDEGARVAIWHEEERVLRDERGAWQSPIRNVRVGIKGKVWEGYGAVGATLQRRERRDSDSASSHKGTATPDEAKVSKAHHLRDGDRGVRSLLHAPDLHRTRTAGSSAGSSGASSPARRGTPSNGVASTSRPAVAQLRQSPMGSRTSLASMPARSSSSSSSAATPVKKVKEGKSKSESSKHPARAPLPPDAVDLVVEDREAALNERSRDRVRGEPALRQGGGIIDGLRRVYRRGFTLSQDEGGGGTDDDHGPVTDRLGDGVEVRVGVVQAEDDEGTREGDRTLDDHERAVWERTSLSSSPPSSPLTPPTTVPREETVIVRAETPPVQIRMAFDEMEGHNNPWA